ncbi:hypothetical protein [Desulfofundulus thermosubterraneus]|uniref:Uncharacterized protein n=1 Tax=Desulfofundulus thermosubterraneus DSM 16057 TaxID=1121432 RepID=A0A1M6JBN9_9FIRM|nr:hypothetical protein [Desulfofundulus thermosubterraneus]SHJ44090.1 hypothetical protein SAMN02745219_02573 [Desulfofundulus thermosubterraneus DSM 16057]
MAKRKQDLFGSLCPVEDIREVSGLGDDGTDFRYGMLVLAGKRYRAISQVRGVNFHLLSDEEKRSAANTLRSCILSLDFPVQFFTVSEMVDLKKAAADLAGAASDLRGGPAEYALAMMDFYTFLSGEKTVKVRRSYAVVGVDTPGESPEQELHKRVLLFRAAMQAGGIRTEMLPPEQVLNLLHDIFNPGRLFRPAESVSSVGAIIDWKGADSFAVPQKKEVQPSF